MYVFERRFTAKHLTMFGFFLTYSQSVRAKKKGKCLVEKSASYSLLELSKLWRNGESGARGPTPLTRRPTSRASRRPSGRPLSWKVRYRTFLWFFSQMSKLYRARSLLYRRQILQENTRWKALDEIYKMYMLLHRSDLNISEIFRKTFSHCSAKFCKNSSFYNSFRWFLLRFWWNFVGISPII